MMKHVNSPFSPFSPFARKVRLVLAHMGLAFEAVDGLLKHQRAALTAANGRVEVPALIDQDDEAANVIVNSADIVSYLGFRYPLPAVHPQTPAQRVHASACERCADSRIDALLINISYWKSAERNDTMSSGLLDAARADMQLVYDALERELGEGEFVSGPLSIADFALFPHIAGVRAMEVDCSPQQYPRLARWFKRLRAWTICAADLQRAREFLATVAQADVETRRVFWRGDRIEWLLARGFHEWFFEGIMARRVLWP